MAAASPSDLASIPLTELDAYANYPALAPPEGVTPNYINPESRGPTVIGVGAVLLIFMVLVYANRIYVKQFEARKLSWDDLSCTIGVLGTTAYYVTLVWAVKKGSIGKHQYDLKVKDVTSNDLLVTVYLSIVLILPTLLFIKLTFFLLYFEIFKPLRWMRIAVYVGATLCTAFYSATTIVQFVFSTPKPGQTWLSSTATGDIYKANELSIPLSAVGTGIDVYLLVLPLVAVAQLQLPRRRKIGVALLFMTGIIACVASALSLYFRIVDHSQSDLTWPIVNIFLMSLVEMNVGVICSCMPFVSKTLKRHPLPTYEKLKSLLLLPSFRFFRICHSPTPTSARTEKSPSGRPLYGGHHTFRPDGSFSNKTYANLEESQTMVDLAVLPGARTSQWRFELGPAESTRTYVASGISADDVEADDDRIHLKHEPR